MKTKIALEIDADVYSSFRVALNENCVKAPMIIMCAMRSFAEGQLIQSGKYLVDPGVSREAPSVKRSVGAPKKDRMEVLTTPTIPIRYDQNPDGSFNRDWFSWDHENMSLDKYTMPPQPHPAADPRPPLRWTTVGPITKQTFDYLCDDYYMKERMMTTTRMWEAVGKKEFLKRCAMKFFALNKTDAYRYDEDSLEDGLAELVARWQGHVESGLANGEMSDEEPT